MSLDLLKQKLKDNKPCGAYLFYGDEEYTKDYYVRELRKKVTSSPFPEFNYIVLDASSASPSELTEAAFTLPYMWDCKMIEVRGIDADSLDAETAEEYAEVIRELSEYIILLFLFRSGELDGGVFDVKSGRQIKSSSDEQDDNSNAVKKERVSGIKVLADAMKKDGLVINFANESGEKLETWINKHFAARKVQAERSAVQTLIALCGSDMYTLHSEIEKLCNSPAPRPIAQESVLKYCCPNESYKVYELSDALTAGDMQRVKRVYDNLVKNKTDPSMLLGYLSKIYSDMLIIQAALEEGNSHGKIAQLIRKSEWQVRKTANGLSKKTSDYIPFACEEIDKTDRKLKRYSVSPYLVLEILLIRIGLYGRK